MTLSITITDANDNPPKFKGAPYSVKLKENTPRGTKLLTLEATDGDDLSQQSATATATANPNAQLRFTIASHASPLVKETFTVHPVSGVLELLKEVDYDRTNTHLYSIPILLTDSMLPFWVFMVYNQKLSQTIKKH